ncbi:MAG: laccase domain-containing protein [Alphaproteobacteria bacterium]|nr:laccase domain-containing protein [Alphaproteobacteria bacterium]
MKVECPFLSQFDGLKHAFFEANPDILKAHKTQAMEAMAGRPLPLVTLKQVHGRKVIRLAQPLDKEIEGDGLVTRVKGIALGISTADCGPLLFYDPVAGIIGACHAGWKGAKEGIIQATIEAMTEEGAKRSQIHATLGPTIQQMNYEVGPEFPALFDGPYETYFRPAHKEEHHCFNLPLYICDQLVKEKIAHIHDLKKNTFTENFYSRRRFLSWDPQGMSFRNLSAIAII